MTSTPLGDADVPESQRSQPQACFPLDLHQCTACGHVQLLDVIDPEMLFAQYSYFSGRSPGMVEHFREYAERVMLRMGAHESPLVVEIGSNDGCFLSFFQQAGWRVLGIDPAANIASAANASGMETWPEFFGPLAADRIRRGRGSAHVVAANNVFAHTDDLAGMAQSVRRLLADDGLFVFEVSYLLDVIDHMLLGTVFHEHLCYHSVKPLAAFLRRHGLELIDVERVSIQGGSLICTAQCVGGSRPVSPAVAELISLEDRRGLHDPATLRAFSARIEAVREDVRNLLAELCAAGKRIAGFGAARAGTLLIYHFGLGGILEFIADDSPGKQNLYSPGYHIPVLPTAAVYQRRPDYLFILAWVHSQTIIRNHRRYLDEGGRFITCFPHMQVVSKETPLSV